MILFIQLEVEFVATKDDTTYIIHYKPVYRPATQETIFHLLFQGYTIVFHCREVEPGVERCNGRHVTSRQLCLTQYFTKNY